MTVSFMRVEIVATDKAKLDAEKVYFDGRVDNVDLHSTLNGGVPTSVVSLASDFGPQKYLFDIYVDDPSKVQGYKDSFHSRLSALNKTAVSSIVCCHNDSCSHDAAYPQPDVVTSDYSYP